jgi:hypothetical protein
MEVILEFLLKLNSHCMVYGWIYSFSIVSYVKKNKLKHYFECKMNIADIYDLEHKNVHLCKQS